MKFLRLYQITIDVYSQKSTLLYENDVILALLNNGEHLKSRYFGVTSPRIQEKTGYTPQTIRKKLSSANVYIYSKNGTDKCLEQNKNTFIGKVIRRLEKLGLIKNQNWKLCMCNYWICDSDTAEKYRVFLNKLHASFYTDKLLNKYINSGTYPHRGKQYPYHPFIYEYFFGLFLAENKQLTIEYL